MRNTTHYLKQFSFKSWRPIKCCLLLLAMIVFGCTDTTEIDRLEAENPSVLSEKHGSLAAKREWLFTGNPRISVCWKNMKEKWKDQGAIIKDEANKSWGDPKKSAVVFTGWGNCGSADIEIQIRTSGKNKCRHGWDGQVTVYLNVNINFDDKKKVASFRSTVAHEFGHALGFVHEHNRPENSDDKHCGKNNQGTTPDTMLTEYDTHSVMGYCKRNKSSYTKITDWDADGLRRAYGFPKAWTRRAGWCKATTSTLHTGDFSGNGHTDILCHNRDSGKIWIDYADTAGHFNGSNWHRDNNWCRSSGSKIYVGDFNGDGKDDLMCYNKSDGKFWIDYYDRTARFRGTDWSRDNNWCRSSDAKLYVDDFNGDGRDDIMCHNKRHGKFWIDYADNNGQFLGTNWSRDNNWCRASSSSLYVGDFNGNGRADVMCHNKSQGKIWIDYASPWGRFTGTNWSIDINWCKDNGSTMHLGDFNGDGNEDILCHWTNGYKWFDFASADGRFYGTDWHGPFRRWCNHQGTQLHVGKFNSDSRADLLCHDQQGTLWTQYPTEFVPLKDQDMSLSLP